MSGIPYPSNARVAAHRRGRGHGRERGFSLIELMIASTLGLLILTSMISVFVATSETRNEVDKNSRQLENGRFAVEMLREDIQLAAFYGDYFPANITWTTPDPCSTILNDMGFTAGNVPVGIRGYPDSTATLGVEPTCVTNRKEGTDILVVRRVSTAQLNVDANEDNTLDTNVTKDDGTTGALLTSLDGGYHLQVSNCAGETPYVLTKDPAGFVLHGLRPSGTPPLCANGARSPVRRYFVRIFYVATCNDCAGLGDGIPTLKMVELTSGTNACMTNPAITCGAMVTRSIAEGVENLQFEYGIDSDSDGTVNTYSTAPALADWPNVTSVKVYLLARNTESTPGYIDTKTYSLASDGSTLTGTPFNDAYKRHVYAATARAINIANRR